MARCGCGGDCGCSAVAGSNVTITGSGSPANPWVINANTNCTTVRQCISANQGAAYNPATGVVSVCVSPNAGNSLVRDVNGCLFVSPGNNAVMTGCGLDGDGTAGNLLRVDTPPYPFACDPATNGMAITCDSNGELRGEPPFNSYYDQAFFENTYPNLTVPLAQNTTVENFSYTYTNPDPCRSVIVYAEQEIDVDFDLPPGAGAEYGNDNDGMYYTRNTGTGTINGAHVQTTKVNIVNFSLGPGASQTLTLRISMGRGTGGATYTRIQNIIRVMMHTLG